MDKISSILPSSARITAVDMKEGGAVRPGVPAFGRAEGVSGRSGELRSRLGETASNAAEIQQKQLNWRDKDLAQAAVASQVSRAFFGHAQNKPDSPVSAKEEISDNNQEREPTYSVPGATSKSNGGKMLAMARDIEESGASKPTGFHNDEIARAIQVRNFHPDVSFENDEVKNGIEEPTFFVRREGASSTSGGRETPRQQPEGLYPKGSFIDRTA